MALNGLSYKKSSNWSLKEPPVVFHLNENIAIFFTSLNGVVLN